MCELLAKNPSFNYAWILISLEINLADSQSKCSLICWISITMSFFISSYILWVVRGSRKIGFDVYLSIRNEYSLASKTSGRRCSFSPWYGADSAVHANSQVLTGHLHICQVIRTPFSMWDTEKEVFCVFFQCHKGFLQFRKLNLS